MNWKAWAPLIVAVVLGVVAAKVARDAISKSNRIDPTAGGKFAHVAVAKRPLSPGQELTNDDLTVGPISAETAPEGTFADASALIGRVATYPIVKGQPILVSMIAPTGAGAGLQALVPVGMRAVTVEINEVSGVAGFLKVGSHVDVISTIRDATTNESVACTIVQNVKVTAIGLKLGNAPTPEDQPVSKSVTLLTMPKQAEAIELATTTGRVRLSLRGNGDEDEAETNGTSLIQLRRNGIKNQTNGQVQQVMNTNTDPFIGSTTNPSHDGGFSGSSRPVQIFRGSQESTVMVEVRRPAPGNFVDTPNEVIAPNQN